ncbi:HEPN domain-containing protein, partial [bacterium]|nr:HEPN domain-containing protein [bacterium]
GWKLKKIHALHDLISDAVEYNSAFESFRQLCERVSGYYFIDRYPPLFPSELTCKDIEEDIKEAKELIQILFSEEELNV